MLAIASKQTAFLAASIVISWLLTADVMAQSSPTPPSATGQPAGLDGQPPVHVPSNGFRVLPNQRRVTEQITDQESPPAAAGATSPNPRQISTTASSTVFDRGVRGARFTQEQDGPDRDAEVVVPSEPLLAPPQGLQIMQQRQESQGLGGFPPSRLNPVAQSPTTSPLREPPPAAQNAQDDPDGEGPRLVALTKGAVEVEPQHSTTSFLDSGNLPYLGAPAHHETPLVQIDVPAITVEAHGPNTLAIHKKSQLRFVARNHGQSVAENVLVSAVLPSWVQISNINTDSGRREIIEDLGAQRVQWSIERLPGQSQWVMTLDVVATKSETFACQLSWAVQPAARQAMIAVTEPRLEMKIAGPREVLFGETETYHVTIRNPGTGVAERIVVMLPEALGGQQEDFGDLEPGAERRFKVELLAKTAGLLDLTTRAIADGNIQTSDTARIMVRRPAVQIAIAGPEMTFAGSVAQFEITLSNPGDAMARDVRAGAALPRGIRYLGGIDTAEVNDSHINWSVGSLDPGEQRTYRLTCQMDADGPVNVEVAARGASDIADMAHCTTQVETVSDVVLSVDEPAGPAVTGVDVEYTIRIKNRGSRAARNLNLVMQFDEGIEPSSAKGHRAQLMPGQVLFATITELAPGGEMTVSVFAKGQRAGSHLYRVQLESADKDTRKVAEGTSKFYGDQIPSQTGGNPSFAPPTNQ